MKQKTNKKRVFLIKNKTDLQTSIFYLENENRVHKKMNWKQYYATCAVYTCKNDAVYFWKPKFIIKIIRQLQNKDHPNARYCSQHIKEMLHLLKIPISDFKKTKEYYETKNKI